MTALPPRHTSSPPHTSSPFRTSASGLRRSLPLPVLLAPAAASTLLALVPVRHPFAAATAGWALSMPAVEMPLHVGALVGAATVPALVRRRGRRQRSSDLVGAGIAALTCAGLGVVFARHLAAAPALERAFAEVQDLPPGSTTTTTPTGPPPTGPPPTRARTPWPAVRLTPWAAVLFAPWPGVPRGVRARRRMAYGPDPKANRFDLYTRTDGGPARGVLIHIHGGHFRAGGPSRESRAMLFGHASRGWAAISTTYHLSPTPESGFPQHLIDIKQLIRWVRTEGPAHGIGAGAPIVVAGSSAGAHIAMMCALTANDPAYQPDFEDLDTSLAGVVGLYGYYGRLGAASKDVSDPGRLPAAGAPPAAIIHGTLDTYTPVKGSRRLVQHLRAGSSNPVIYAELPGAQHGFDAVRKPRYSAVVAAVARFTDRYA